MYLSDKSNSLGLTSRKVTRVKRVRELTLNSPEYLVSYILAVVRRYLVGHILPGIFYRSFDIDSFETPKNSFFVIIPQSDYPQPQATYV